MSPQSSFDSDDTSLSSVDITLGPHNAASSLPHPSDESLEDLTFSPDDTFAAGEIDFDGPSLDLDLEDSLSLTTVDELPTPEASFSPSPEDHSLDDDRILATPLSTEVLTPSTTPLFFQPNGVPFPSQRHNQFQTKEEYLQQELDRSHAEEDKHKARSAHMAAHIRDLEDRLGAALPERDRLEKENTTLQCELQDVMARYANAESYIKDQHAHSEQLDREKDHLQELLLKQRGRMSQVVTECRLGDAEVASLTAESAIEGLSRRMDSVCVDTIADSGTSDLHEVEDILQAMTLEMERSMDNAQQRTVQANDSIVALFNTTTRYIKLSQSQNQSLAARLEATIDEKEQLEKDNGALRLQLHKLELQAAATVSNPPKAPGRSTATLRILELQSQVLRMSTRMQEGRRRSEEKVEQLVAPHNAESLQDPLATGPPYATASAPTSIIATSFPSIPSIPPNHRALFESLTTPVPTGFIAHLSPAWVGLLTSIVFLAALALAVLPGLPRSRCATRLDDLGVNCSFEA